jgi:hypothetical protein
VRLDLTGCGLDDNVVPLLAENPALANLRALSLGGTRLSERSLLALARSPHLQAIPRMGLSSAGLPGPAAQLELDRRFGRGWQYYVDPGEDPLS